MVDYSKQNIRTWSRLGPCGAYGIAMLEIIENNNKVVSLTADLCNFSGLKRVSEKFPNNFYNVGIAEQNLVAVASDMAHEGLIPFASTYATFATARALDQVRVNMGYMENNIKLVGLTSGFAVGLLGSTHISIDDVSILRGIPNIDIICPSDCTQVVKTIIATSENNRPTYIRLTGEMNMPIIYKEDFDFEIGKAITLVDGSDIAIIATGSMVHKALESAAVLEEHNISTCVIDMHTIKPIDEDAIKFACSKKVVISIEEHNIIGGLSDAIAFTKSKYNLNTPHIMIGINDTFIKAGSYNHLLDQYNLTTEKITNTILNSIKSYI